MLLETGNLELFVFNRLTHRMVSSLPGLFLEDGQKFCLLRENYLELVYPVSPCIKIFTRPGTLAQLVVSTLGKLRQGDC